MTKPMQVTRAPVYVPSYADLSAHDPPRDASGLVCLVAIALFVCTMLVWSAFLGGA